jgi:formylglycine-generating enzyme required for sulfatase activity
MKQSLFSMFGLVILASVSLVGTASAVVNIDFVPVENAGNANDTTGYGAVSSSYQIGKYEVTNSQYAEFLSAKGSSNSFGIFNSSMATYGITQTGSPGSFSYSVTSGFENKPVVYVSWFDAARFINWLSNGQGNGDTETGPYTLAGATSGTSFAKNPGATLYLPTESQWYKAAYYDATKDGTGGYWQVPTQSATLGGNTIGNANSANYFDGDHVSFPGTQTTDVGAYGTNSDSFYGTFDQGGNVWEWNDAVLGTSRGLRGGAWNSVSGVLASTLRGGSNPSNETADVGFRVASIPEPGSVALTLLATGMLVSRRRR